MRQARGFAWVLRVAGAGIVLAGLAACNATMTATAPAPALRAPGTPIAFVGVQGPTPDIAQKYEIVLAEEAKKRGFEVVPAVGAAPNAMRVRTWLDAFPAGEGKAGFAWVVDASDNGRTRIARTNGAATTNAPATSSWTAFDAQSMRQIAGASLDDLLRQIQGGAAPAGGADEQ